MPRSIPTATTPTILAVYPYIHNKRRPRIDASPDLKLIVAVASIRINTVPVVRGILAILSMLDCSTTNFLSIYWICGSNTLCSASSACQQEIFGGRNFCENKFSRAGIWSQKSRKFLPHENFPLYGIPLLSIALYSAVFAFRPFANLASHTHYSWAMQEYKLLEGRRE